MRNQKGFTLIELLIVVAIIGIIAAIAIPSLLRARVSANESAAIGDTRTISSSASAYESAAQGNGYPADITCLSTPSAAPCLGVIGYPATAPTFIDASLATATGAAQPKSGYVRTWSAGANAVGTGKDGFCYQAAPQTWNRTGVQTFGSDNSGVLGGTNTNAAVCCVAGVLDTAACPARK